MTPPPSPSETVAAVLASLQHGIASDQPRISHREFRRQARERALTAEQQVWSPLRIAARDRGAL